MGKWIVFSAALAACAVAHAQTLPAPASPVPQEVLRGLGNANFTTREIAQKRLDAVPLEQRDALEQLAHKMTDAEIQARLMARVDEMDTELAIDPPPISIDIKNATTDQVADALSKAMGISMSAHIGPAQLADRFTLSVKDKPFWEIFYLLHGQHPITFARGSKGDWILNDDGSKADVPLEFVKGMLVEVSPAKGQALPAPAARIVMGGPGGAAAVLVAGDDPAAIYPAGLAVMFRITADPRIEVQTMDVHVQPDLRDGKNQSLKVVSVDPNGARKAKEFSWGYKASIGTPAEVGKTIQSIKATAVMTVPVDMRRVVVDTPLKSVEKPIKVGGATFTIARFEDDGIRLTYRIDVATGVPEATSIALVDGDGNRISYVDGGRVMAGSMTTSLNPPYKLELVAPRSLKEITLPLEWTDVPIESLPVKRPAGALPAGGGGVIQGDFIVGPVLRQF